MLGGLIGDVAAPLIHAWRADRGVRMFTYYMMAATLGNG
jgi:hypothetical protein